MSRTAASKANTGALLRGASLADRTAAPKTNAAPPEAAGPALLADLRPVLRCFLRAQPGLLSLGALLAGLTVCMGMALLGLSGWFISATALAGLQAATAIGFDVFTPSAGIRLLALGRTLSRYGERVLTHDATFGVLAELRVRLFRGWARPDAARRLLARPARLLFRLTADIDALETLYLRLLVPGGAALCAALLAGALLGSMKGWMGLLLALWLVGAGWGIACFGAVRARPAAVRRAHAIERLRARAADLVAGQTELLMAGRIEASRAGLAAADRQLARADQALNRLEAQLGFAYGIAGTLTLCAVLLAVGWLVGDGAIGVPAAVLALLVALGAIEPFAGLRRGALEAGRAWLAARRLGPRIAGEAEASSTHDARLPAAAREAIATPTAAAELPGAHPDRAAAAIALHDACVIHPGAAAPVLQALSLRIGAGERVALVGASGAGKSTLMALVAGELTPVSGALHAAPNCLLTQRTELFQDSLRENLRLADPSADDRRLWQVLAAAGLEQDVRGFAAGLDTSLGEGGLGLSGGQSRRLALARLLLRDPPLWLLDEATEGLDADVARDVLGRLALQADGRTLLVATHLRREAALADRLLCMAQGRITADHQRGSAAFDAALVALRPD